jgi:carbon-monoxide dehydrogenase medium subunit
VGAWLQLDNGKIKDARLCLASVAPTPVFAKEACQYLIGKQATEATFAEAGEIAKKAAKPINDMRGTIEHRIHLVGVLTRRALTRAAARARGEE